MQKIINISATIKGLSIGDSFSIPFKDMSDGSVKASAYRIKGKKFTIKVDRQRMRTLVTRIS